MTQGRNKHLVVVARCDNLDVVCSPQVGEVPSTGSCQPAQLKLSVNTSPIRFGRLPSQVKNRTEHSSPL